MQQPRHEMEEKYANHPEFCLKHDVSGRMTPGNISHAAGVEEKLKYLETMKRL